jgi:hypothetical protein
MIARERQAAQLPTINFGKMFIPVLCHHFGSARRYESKTRIPSFGLMWASSWRSAATAPTESNLLVEASCGAIGGSSAPWSRWKKRQRRRSTESTHRQTAACPRYWTSSFPPHQPDNLPSFRRRTAPTVELAFGSKGSSHLCNLFHVVQPFPSDHLYSLICNCPQFAPKCWKNRFPIGCIHGTIVLFVCSVCLYRARAREEL